MSEVFYQYDTAKQACLQIETPEYISKINMPLSNCLSINKMLGTDHIDIQLCILIVLSFQKFYYYSSS